MHYELLSACDFLPCKLAGLTRRRRSAIMFILNLERIQLFILCHFVCLKYLFHAKLRRNVLLVLIGDQILQQGRIT